MNKILFTPDFLNLTNVIETSNATYIVSEIEETVKHYIDCDSKVKERKIFLAKIKDKTTQNLDKEIWKNIKGYNGVYQVSNFGNVRNCINGNILSIKPEPARSNVRVGLQKNGKQKMCSVHRLVAEAFLENPNSYKYVVRKDGDYKNNRLDNLIFVKSLKETYRAKNIMNKSNMNPGSIPAQMIINSDLEIFENMQQASERLGIEASSISRCLKGLQKTAGGLYWEFIN